MLYPGHRSIQRLHSQNPVRFQNSADCLGCSTVCISTRRQLQLSAPCQKGD